MTLGKSLWPVCAGVSSSGIVHKKYKLIDNQTLHQSRAFLDIKSYTCMCICTHTHTPVGVISHSGQRVSSALVIVSPIYFLRNGFLHRFFSIFNQGHEWGSSIQGSVSVPLFVTKIRYFASYPGTDFSYCQSKIGKNPGISTKLMIHVLVEAFLPKGLISFSLFSKVPQWL